MHEIFFFLEEINLENGANYKLGVLEKYKNSDFLKEVLQKTYDKVQWTYGVKNKVIDKSLELISSDPDFSIEIEERVKMLEKLHNREYTGDAAVEYLSTILNTYKEAQDLLIKILRRDLKIGVGRTQINKVFKDLVVKRPYMRCDILTKDHIDKKTNKQKKGSVNNIDFSNGAYIQLKADGRYTETVALDSVEFFSRSGEQLEYPFISKLLEPISGYYLHGEMTVLLDDELLNAILPKLEKADKKNGTNNVQMIAESYAAAKENEEEYILPRSIGNGLLNSKNVPEHNIIYDLWDCVSQEDVALAALKDKKNHPKETYEERFARLKDFVSFLHNISIDAQKHIRIIEYKEAFSLKEAMEFVAEKMNQGLEGGILKDKSFVYKDGTSKYQLKCKLIISGEFRVVGFLKGTPGTKNEDRYSSFVFQNDEQTIKGSVSNLSDELMDDINANSDKWLNKIIEIEFNDITRGRNSTTYALSHPRFIADRSNEKNETDTLERCFKMKEMAMMLS